MNKRQTRGFVRKRLIVEDIKLRIELVNVQILLRIGIIGNGISTGTKGTHRPIMEALTGAVSIIHMGLGALEPILEVLRRAVAGALQLLPAHGPDSGGIPMLRAPKKRTLIRI